MNIAQVKSEYTITGRELQQVKTNFIGSNSEKIKESREKIPPQSAREDFFPSAQIENQRRILFMPKGDAVCQQKSEFTQKPFQKIPEACKTTGLSRYYLRKGCKTGTIPHVRSGPTYYINVPELLRRLNAESGRTG